MSDRLALVTGASRGIGFGIAERLTSRGFGLTIIARSEDTLRAAAGQLIAVGAPTGGPSPAMRRSWTPGPLLLSSLTQRVDRVTIHCTAQMDRYGAIFSGFGLGLSPEQFDVEQAASDVVGTSASNRASPPSPQALDGCWTKSSCNPSDQPSSQPLPGAVNTS